MNDDRRELLESEREDLLGAAQSVSEAALSTRLRQFLNYFAKHDTVDTQKMEIRYAGIARPTPPVTGAQAYPSEWKGVRAPEPEGRPSKTVHTRRLQPTPQPTPRPLVAPSPSTDVDEAEALYRDLPHDSWRHR